MNLANRIGELALRSNSSAIAEVAAEGDVAVVVFEPQTEAREAAVSLGWNQVTPVFRLSRPRLRRLAAVSDGVTAAWLTRKSKLPRVLLISGRGTLLLNFHSGEGWAMEPGSTDQELA